jgi:putative holliday junction resolvase
MRVLGIDFGERRVGLAITDASATLARPLRTLRREASGPRLVADLLAEIDRLIEEDGLSCIVVGLPLRLDGSPTGLTDRVRALARTLTTHTNVRVVLQDERLTSREAEQRLALREPDWRKRKARLDAAAAAVILQDYLDEHPGDASPDGRPR